MQEKSKSRKGKYVFERKSTAMIVPKCRKPKTILVPLSFSEFSKILYNSNRQFEHKIKTHHF